MFSAIVDMSDNNPNAQHPLALPQPPATLAPDLYPSELRCQRRLHFLKRWPLLLQPRL